MRSVIFTAGLLALISGQPVLADVSPLTVEQRAAMTGKAWQPGCPVALDDLASVRVRYWGFDAVAHDGVVVIHKSFAEDLDKIFAELYAAKFPMANVSTYENYDIGRSAYSDATVGFYCRRAQDAPGEWSGHAYGAAIDINPLENPFLDPTDGWWPEQAAAMAPREPGRGKIYPDSEIFRIFVAHGWSWGGFYKGEPDYMHFYRPKPE